MFTTALSFQWKLGTNARNMGGIPGAMPTQILFGSEIFLYIHVDIHLTQTRQTKHIFQMLAFESV